MREGQAPRRRSDAREPLRRDSNVFNHLRRNAQLEALQQFAELVAVDQVDWKGFSTTLMAREL